MHYLITGGAGFIGSNLAERLIGRGNRVVVYDNLSRPGVQDNLAWLKGRHGASAFEAVTADVRDLAVLGRSMAGVDVVIHLAGQTAVTRSVADPLADFEDNARGTLHVLEAARQAPRPPILLYASTNKVYGRLERARIVENPTRYAFEDRPHGIDEDEPLDFISPYGCSKGAGDQYVRDYAKIYGLRTVVFRQSCIYGTHQMGDTNQGWLAWLLTAARTGQAITIYGDGKQVRDVLYVDDLLDAYDLAIEHIDSAAGQVYNIGGGPRHTLSVWAEFSKLIERRLGSLPDVEFSAWRPGDQRVYVSDIRKAARELGWQPRIDVESGVGRLGDWIDERLAGNGR